MSASRAVLVVLGILAVFALVGWRRLIERSADSTKTEAVAVSEIRVRPGSGSVTVRTNGAQHTRITSAIRYRGGAPRSVYHLDGTVLTINTSCGRYCSVSFDIEAPTGVRVSGENGSGQIDLSGVSSVDLTTGSGGITVKGASGSVVARSGSGPIHLYGVAGELTAESSSGNVDADGVRSPTSRIQTSSGDIHLGLDQPGTVDAQSSSGDVRVAVPAGRYRIEATSSSGNTDLRLADDSGGPHRLLLRSSSGDITLTERAH